MKQAREFFYREDGQRQDAELHDPIIETGDHDAAADVSRSVMRRLGIAPERIAGLLGQKPTKEKTARWAAIRARAERVLGARK